MKKNNSTYFYVTKGKNTPQRYVFLEILFDLTKTLTRDIPYICPSKSKIFYGF